MGGLIGLNGKPANLGNLQLGGTSNSITLPKNTGFTTGSGSGLTSLSGGLPISLGSVLSSPTPQNIPQAPTPTRVGAGSGTSGTGSIADPAAMAEASDLISQSQNILDRLANQRNVGYGNITDSFGTARNSLNSSKGRVERDYTDNRVDTIKQNEVAKNRIDQQVRSRSNALSRLMGAAGAGDSQAALQLAPYAAARTGTNLRQQVNQNYSSNLKGLDTSWGDYLQDFTSALGDLDAQEKNKRNEFEGNILNTELSARDNLRKGQSALEYAKTGNADAARRLRSDSLPLMFQILQQIDNLGRQSFNPNTQQVAYEAPELQGYSTDNLQSVGGIDPNMGGDISPAYQYLLQKQKDDQDYFGY